MRHIEENSVLIVSTTLDHKKEDVYKALNNDQILVDSINEYKKVLVDEDIEIFHEKENILITESGYYVALYVKDVNTIIESEIDE